MAEEKEKKKVWVVARKRFNHHAEGEKFKADAGDAEKWVGEGLAKYSKEPPEDKAQKGADVTK